MTPMTSCAAVRDRLHAFIDGELAPAEHAAMLSHLDDCGACAACGDNFCSNSETCQSCQADCGNCTHCTHSPCAVGARLDAGCNDCTRTVCQTLSSCCTTTWDSTCQLYAQLLCNGCM